MWTENLIKFFFSPPDAKEVYIILPPLSKISRLIFLLQMDYYKTSQKSTCKISKLQTEVVIIAGSIFKTTKHFH